MVRALSSVTAATLVIVCLALLPPNAAGDDPWDDCDQGEIHDTWWQDGGLTWPDTVTQGTYVELFTPSQYPFSYTRVCSKWCSQFADSTLNYTVVIYDDNGTTGPGGEPGPGTLLASVPATAVDVPNPGGGICGYYDYEWFGANIAGVPDIEEGSVFIGVQLNASVELGFYLGVDSSDELPQWVGWHSPNGGASWDWNGYISNPDYKALMIRAQALQDDQTIVFLDGFESGDTSGWE